MIISNFMNIIAPPLWYLCSGENPACLFPFITPLFSSRTPCPYTEHIVFIYFILFVCSHSLHLVCLHPEHHLCSYSSICSVPSYHSVHFLFFQYTLSASSKSCSLIHYTLFSFSISSPYLICFVLCSMLCPIIQNTFFSSTAPCLQSFSLPSCLSSFNHVYPYRVPHSIHLVIHTQFAISSSDKSSCYRIWQTWPNMNYLCCML